MALQAPLRERRRALSHKDATDVAQELRVRRFLLGSITYMLAIAVAAIGALMGIWSMDVLAIYVIIVIGANTIFYCIIRLNLNLRFDDPSLTTAQLATAVGALMYFAYHAGPARGIVMLWVLMIFMFAVFRLRSNQLWQLAALTWVAYGAVVGMLLRNHSATINANLEIFQWLVLGTVLTWFSFMGGYVSNMRSASRRNEIFYQSMWETAHDAIIIVGSGGQIEYANPAVQSVFGRAPDKLAGTSLHQLLAKSVSRTQAEGFRQYIDHGASAQDWAEAELTFTRDDGTEFLAEVSADEMTIENRRACLLFVRNIAARKQSEQALVAARISAEAASRAKSQFLANMTHEMRTPMNGIIGMAEILQQEKLDDSASRYVEKIHRSGRALLGVVNDVLDFSKLEEGHLDVERVVFDLPRVIQEVHDLYADSAQAKNIELRWEVARTVPPLVFGDPSRLRQMLSNLIANAVKFTERGHIELRATPEGADQVRFEVRDTGIGIALDQQKIIFDAFVQVDGSTTRRFGGTGLGLTITRQIVQLLGGKIGMSSEPGKGSRFWLTVPLPRSAQRQVADGTTTNTVQAVKARFSGKRILLVEDDESNAEIAMVLLGKLGPEITHVVNGALAVAACRNTEFDMVFMDCQMPVMDGLEATRQIRAIEQQNPSRKRMPITALTAHSFDGYREECLAADMDDYMTKPVSTEDFLNMLTRWLGNTPQVTAV